MAKMIDCKSVGCITASEFQLVSFLNEINDDVIFNISKDILQRRSSETQQCKKTVFFKTKTAPAKIEASVSTYHINVITSTISFQPLNY